MLYANVSIIRWPYASIQQRIVMDKSEIGRAMAALGHAKLGETGRKERALKAAKARWKGHKKSTKAKAKVLKK
jgi:hypothetical protein